MRRIGTLVILGVLAAGLPGCVVAAVAVGAAGAYGVVQYVDNESTRTFPATLPDTWDATVSAMKGLGYRVPDEASHGLTQGFIEAGETSVTLEIVPGTRTEVRVRVGTFDSDEHRRQGEELLEAIGYELSDRGKLRHSSQDVN